MLRLLLPPNLPAGSVRNAIAVKVELDLASVPPPALLPVLALLAKLVGNAPATGTVQAILQLNRTQLREIIAAARGQSVFFWTNAPATPIAWLGDRLVGVSAHLAEPAAPAPTALAAATGAPAPRRRAGAPATPLTVDGSEHFLALTLPSPEHRSYAPSLELVRSRGFVLEPSNRRWWLRDRHKVLNLLAEQRGRWRDEFGAQFTPNFDKNFRHLQAAEVVCEAVGQEAGFEVVLGLKAGAAPETEIRSAMASSRGYVEAEGKIFLLDPATVRRVTEAQRALAGDPLAGVAVRRTQRVSGARVVELDEILAELSPAFEPPAAWKERSEALRHLSSLAPAPLSPEFERQLRPYQKLGAAWLWYLYHQRLGGVLADEMGLGKTLQALALLTALSGQPRGEAGVSLVICPASLLENWRRETLRFAPGLRVCVHHGEGRLSAKDLGTQDLVITSYGTLARDQAVFGDFEFACVIADEAQHIKNRRSQNARSLRALRARGRFLLTGTPLENSLDDLRSLFEFLLPGFLDPVPAGTRGEDKQWLDERLRAKTAPFILRRTKQAVAPELPAKIEQVQWCEMGPAQAALYRATQERSEREVFDLEAGGASEARVRLAALTQLLRLRQICCDPRLLPGAQAGAAPVESAKLDALLELLAEAVDDGHRVLIFSQFTSLLALLRPELEAQGLAHCYLDGAMTPPARQAEVDRFQGTPDIPVFLLSLKAGGTGLNLTGADTVVHFDPWWNPAVEAQATDRAHRIGQSRTVTSYKLIAAGTVEEKVLGLQQEKRALLAEVFEASDVAAAKLSLSDLKGMLKA